MILAETTNLSLPEIFCSLWARVLPFGRLDSGRQDVRDTIRTLEINNVSGDERFVSLESILQAQIELAPFVGYIRRPGRCS